MRLELEPDASDYDVAPADEMVDFARDPLQQLETESDQQQRSPTPAAAPIVDPFTSIGALDSGTANSNSQLDYQQSRSANQHA